VLPHRDDSDVEAPAPPSVFATPGEGEGHARHDPESAFGLYLEMARLLGRRTGEMHTALAIDHDDPAFSPEVAVPFARRSHYQALRNLAVRSLDLLAGRREALPEPLGDAAAAILERRQEILDRLRGIVDEPLGGSLIRIHGDFHLGQVLYTGRDFVIVDFEGEPARSLAERRRKRSPLTDVAGMLRSYHYAVETVLSQSTQRSGLRPGDSERLRPWANHWLAAVSRSFLGGYVAAARDAEILPPADAQLKRLLEIHLLEKALYELGYELNNRPAWAGIPLRGIVALLAEPRDGSDAG